MQLVLLDHEAVAVRIILELVGVVQNIIDKRHETRAWVEDESGNEALY